MTVARLDHREPRPFEQVLGIGLDLLPMLKRTGRVIGDGHVLRRAFGHVEFHQDFAHVHGNDGHPRRIIGQRIISEHVPVILDRRAAAGSVDDNGIEAFAVHFAGPRGDVFGGSLVALFRFAHVMGQRAAASRPVGHDNLGPEPRQQTNGGIVDIGVERLLCTARHQRHAHLFRCCRRKALRVVIAADRRDVFRRHFQHRA